MTKPKTTLQKLTPEQRERVAQGVEDVLRKVFPERYVTAEDPVIEEQAVVKKPKAPSKRGANLKSGDGSARFAERKHDWDKIIELFDGGMRASEIAREVGAGDSTVRDILRKNGRQPGASGPRRKEECKRGHSLAEHGRELKGGGRECMACKKERSS